MGFLFGFSRFGGSCSLEEHGTVKVVGRVRRVVIVYRREGLRGIISQVGLRDGSLPCGGCQRFESAYLQPMIQVDGIAHTSME